ncbi:MAG: hypothetical protein GY756_10175 [bacterium]|nr:hypothetical protein [bacterium]
MKNYTGNKGGLNISHFLINYIPLSKRYFSLFYGQGGLENSPLLSGVNWLCSEKDHALHSFSTTSAVIVESCYKDLVATFTFTQDDFIFADPPYLFSTRLSKKPIYKHEFDIPEHEVFLDYMISLNCRILITHPYSALYAKKLENWSFVPFQYQSRGGLFKDGIWFNFAPGNVALVNYSCLGHNNIKRQQIKRKRLRFVNKFNALSFHEKQAIIQELGL